MPAVRRLRAVVAAVAVTVPLTLTASAGTPGAQAAPRPPAAQPSTSLAEDLLVIGHRGASGYRPEHTLASYELAARMGADYIEPDVVSTRDGVLVARHENEISGTTDVASRPEFAARRTTKTIDGVEYTGWFTEDFTLAELKTLRAIERLPELRQESTTFDGLYEVPTLEEVLELRSRLSDELDREVGVYIETKHPTYFDGLGLSLEEPLREVLRDARLDRRGAPVFVQSFETANLRELDEQGLGVPLVQLLSAAGAPADLVAAGDPRTYADLATPAGLDAIDEYADGIGPDKVQVIPLTAEGNLGTPTTLVPDAHAEGLLVHPYTFRPENSFLPADHDLGADPADYGRALDEQLAFWRAGVDGIFTDTPDIGVESRRLFLETPGGVAAP